MTGSGTDDDREERDATGQESDRVRPGAGTDDHDGPAGDDDTTADDPRRQNDHSTAEDTRGWNDDTAAEDRSPQDDGSPSGSSRDFDDGTTPSPPAESPSQGTDDGPGESGSRPEPDAEPATTTGPDTRVGTGTDDASPPIPGADDESRREFDNPLDWFFNTDDPLVVTVRDVGSSLLTVAVLGLVLFAVSGLWPPLVAVESGSMEPHMHKNDLVFIVEEERFAGDSAQAGTGVVTYRAAERNQGYWSFGDYGNVVVFQPDGSQRRTPIIHRARFWVEEGENWVDPPSEGGTGKANPEYLSREPSADRDFDCEEVSACRPEHSGFITKGDANSVYDQVGGQSGVVRPEWVRGKAKVRIPLLGWIRLQFAQLATAFGGVGPTSLGVLRLQLGVVFAGIGAVVSRRRGVL